MEFNGLIEGWRCHSVTEEELGRKTQVRRKEREHENVKVWERRRSTVETVPEAVTPGDESRKNAKITKNINERKKL